MGPIHRILEKTREPVEVGKVRLEYKATHSAGMADLEYRILGCRNPGADAVCCSTLQKVARGLARRLAKRVREEDDTTRVNLKK